MSYPWTRVPAGDPPVDPLQLRLLPTVDLVMGLLWSRPGGLSLKTTWVTPATIALGLMVGMIAGLGGLFIVAFGFGSGNLLEIIAGMVGCVVSVGSGCVGLFGIRQRLIRD